MEGSDAEWEIQTRCVFQGPHESLCVLMSTRLPDRYCPACAHLNDAVTEVREQGAPSSPGDPSPGDLSLCIYCCAMLQFNEDLKFVILTPQAYLDLPDDARLLLAQARKTLIELREGSQ